ncbi:hypothetical protein DICSQDRAFT_131242 [Dichomitus squalens LYAD-421 SS1]|uniref:uncharacterized protein n=1 Tax=Dichomitus squalens (strain LYAD-421) TaxID=732165 RepID=UPI0004413865|nr:uncharacterized protein DICSQDRAFT_131242 [Dichomitus squalens LYAD-421 SS1]EJF66963.1 hypothetical protein DICSQDRAFT_131242 [Dichomitus squalens LYAD-421 SS1]
MSVPRSHSVPHFTSASLRRTKISSGVPATDDADIHARAKLPRHRSTAAIASTKHWASVYTPRVEKEDPFSLSGFFPANFTALEHSGAEQEWDWLRASSGDVDESGLVSPVTESEDEWNLPTPCSEDAVDAFANEAIEREDKLGILALSSDSFLPSRGDELYVESEEHILLSPFTRTGDPLDADAVVDALRALRTAYSLPSGSAVKHESAALHELFSPEKESDDKVKVEAGGWGALVSWGVSRVEDYFSPAVSD